MHEQVCCRDEAVNHQLPIAAAFWILWVVSTEECSCLTQNLLQICCSTCSVTLNAKATQYTCSLNGIYCPHCLVQWSCHWLPGYIDVMQAGLIILTMAGFFWTNLTWVLQILIWIVFDNLPIPSLINELIKILTCTHFVFVWESWAHLLKSYLLTQFPMMLMRLHWSFSWLSSWPLLPSTTFLHPLGEGERFLPLALTHELVLTDRILSSLRPLTERPREQGLASQSPTLRDGVLRKKWSMHPSLGVNTEMRCL